MNSAILTKLAGANMDIDLATPTGQITWSQNPCPWNLDEGGEAHRCAQKNVSICQYFCGIEYLDVVQCSYPHPNPYQQSPAPKVDWEIKGPVYGGGKACQPVLEALPDWFGIQDANRQYLRDIETLPTFLVTLEDRVVGFLSILDHSDSAAEIHILGVERAYHRQGIGTALVRACERYLSAHRVEFLQVKTLSESHPDVNYAKTRAFYQAMGFKKLQELPTLWGEANPCLMLVKSLRVV